MFPISCVVSINQSFTGNKTSTLIYFTLLEENEMYFLGAMLSNFYIRQFLHPINLWLWCHVQIVEYLVPECISDKLSSNFFF
jgi:hypothetical protein